MNPALAPFQASSAASATFAATPVPEQRLASLDALRGFDMLWIVGGAAVVHALHGLGDNSVTRWLDGQFEHVQWEGFHFYDLIYPLFLFLIGISIVLSLDKALALGNRRSALFRILRRSLALYLLNFVYNGGFSNRWPDMRVVSGVLAMIAASYLLGALLYLYFGRNLKALATITAALLLGNWAILGMIPFPDFKLEGKTVAALATQAGSRDPAAISALVPQRTHGTYEEAHNLSNYLDYRYIPGKKVAGFYENQGLLSPLTSVTLCLAGIFAARLLLAPRPSPHRKVAWLACGGLGALLLGVLWGLELPIVKKLWTASFCLVTAGCSALLLALFYLVVDVWKMQRWCRPLVWIGVNPITIYLLYELVGFSKIAERLVGGDVKAWLEHLAKGLGGLAVAAVSLSLVLLLMRFLHQRRIFIRV